MNDAMNQLILLTMIAVYHEHGQVKAIEYAQKQGWSTQEAFDALEAYEQAWDRVKQGKVV